MKSAYRIAKEIGVTPQAIYKRLTPDFKEQLVNHIEKKNNITLFDELAEQLIKQSFNKNEQPNEDVAQLVGEAVDKPGVQLHTYSSIEQFQGNQKVNNDPNAFMLTMLTNQQQEIAKLLNKFDRIVDVLDNPVTQSLNKPNELIDEPLTNTLVDQLQTENQFLKDQNHDLSHELKTEREHGRNQAVKLSELMTQYSEITRNQQVLLGREQGLHNTSSILNQAEDEVINHNDSAPSDDDSKEKLGFLQRIFGRK